MATEVNLPDLGENIEAGEVVSILVAVGDAVEADQPVLEIETGKAAVELPAGAEGTIAKIHVEVGEEVRVGQLVLTIDSSGEAAGGGAAAPTATAAEPEPPRPEPTASMETVVLEPAAKGSSPPPTSPPRATEQSAAATVPASPSVRRLAREIGVDVGEVKGTGPGGRISADDVKDHARHSTAPSGGRATAAEPLPDFSQWGPVRRERMSGVRRATARHLSHAWSTIPHVTQADKADITDLEAWRKRTGKRVEAAGGKLTVTSIALKIVAAALKQFPQVNASVDETNDEIVLKDYYDIGVAVDTPRGLVVPVVRGVDTKSVQDLSIELNEIAAKARDGKLTMADMQGGTFTITNLGGLGTTEFTPIVNWPEVAILGLARATREAVYVDGEFVPRLMMPMFLSYDHRVIDGADAARFNRWLAEAFESPFLAI